MSARESGRPGHSPVQHPGTARLEADLAARTALLSSMGWLVLAALVGLTAAVATAVPGLHLDGVSVRAVARILTTFGFLTTAGFAAIFAILPRVLGVRLHSEVLAAASVIWWNLFLTGGAVAIALGRSGAGIGSLPVSVCGGLAITLIAVGFDVLATVGRRRERTLYPAAWFLIAAPVALLVAVVCGSLSFMGGGAGEVLRSFGAELVHPAWLFAVLVGAAFYVVPQATGNPLHSKQLAVICFGSLAVAGLWAGFRGSPAGWLAAVGAGMSLVLLVPALSAASDLFATARGRWTFIADDPGLRWTATGLVLAVVWAGARAITSTSKLFETTEFVAGVWTFAAWGAFAALAFGFLTHMYPRLTGRAWWSRRLSNFHFWTTLAAAVGGSGSLLVAGLLRAAAGAEAPGLRTLQLAAGVFVLAGTVAQAAFVINAYKTSRAGDPLHLVIQQAVAA